MQGICWDPELLSYPQKGRLSTGIKNWIFL